MFFRPAEHKEENLPIVVITDLAGTVVDEDCFAPIFAFKKAIDEVPGGKQITIADIRKDMGKEKREHIQEILSMLDRRKIEKSDPRINQVYERYLDFQLGRKGEESILAQHATAIDGAANLSRYCKDYNIIFIATTGYSENETRILQPLLAEQKVHFDEVIPKKPGMRGRPFPDVINYVAKKYDTPHNRIIVLDDTPPGLLATKHPELEEKASWSVLLTNNSSGLNFTSHEESRRVKSNPEKFNAKVFDLIKKHGQFADRIARDPNDVVQLLENDLIPKIRNGKKPGKIDVAEHQGIRLRANL
jgi:beta-phosphoglucomutase-like phosphatase (HAD superfamily)